MQSCPPPLNTSASFLSAQSQVPSTLPPPAGQARASAGSRTPCPSLTSGHRPRASSGYPRPSPFCSMLGSHTHAFSLPGKQCFLLSQRPQGSFLPEPSLMASATGIVTHLFSPLTMRSSGTETASESCFYPKCLEQCVAQHGTNEGTNKSIKGKEGTIVHN